MEDGGIQSSGSHGAGAMSRVVKNHLKKVYSTFFFAFLASALGAYIDLYLNFGGLATSVSTTACAFIVQFYARRSRRLMRLRFWVLMISSFLGGPTLGSLIEIMIGVDARIPIIVFVGAEITPLCFMGALFFGKETDTIYVIGVISSCVGIILWLLIASLIYGTWYCSPWIWLTLFGFAGVVGSRTEEAANQLELDYMATVLDMTGHFVVLGGEIFHLLLRINQEERKEERETTNSTKSKSKKA